MEVNLRPARREEAEAVLSVFRRATEQMRRQGIDQWSEAYPSDQLLREDISEERMYILEAGGAFVSAVVLDSELLPEEYEAGRWEDVTGRFGVVHRLCVSPERQNEGWGRKTMGLAQSWFKEKDYTSVRLDAFSQNPYALRLYRSLGYRETGTVMLGHGLFILFEKHL